MIEIQKITEHISCFKVPYKDIFVGIYVLRADEGVILFDTAACDADVDNWIAPALEQLGVVPTHIFIYHNHTDHAGGIARAAALWPEAVILSRSPKLQEAYPNAKHPEDWRILLDTFQVVTIPGHTMDAAALLDLRTNTLVCGDCLQSFGIYGSGYWYGAITYPAEHFAAINKLRELPIENIATAHDYHPVGMVSYGKDAAMQRLDSCVDALDRVRKIAEMHPDLDEKQVAELCNDGTFPKVAGRVIAALRKAAAEGRI